MRSSRLKLVLAAAAVWSCWVAPVWAQSAGDDSANYRLTFRGTWTRSVTPGGVPGRAHFSPLIGAVHNDQVSFWQPGSRASRQMERVAELGIQRDLRALMERSSDVIAVLEREPPRGGTASTTIEFEVTRQYPLVTLATMIAPSPDWFVGVWVALLIAIGAVAMTVRRTRQNRERETGQPQFANRWAFGIFAVGALVTFVILGLPVSIDRPYIEGTRYLEGMVIRPEFAALTFGLTLYTGAFNAEIVRGSIQALPTGQTEAANAIGLSGYQRLTLVILPQALRQMIPSITNQYLNVNKNSSLAYAVLYDDLFRVAGIIQNKAGHALEMFFVIIVTYMLISLVISAVMNLINSRVTRVGV